MVDQCSNKNNIYRGSVRKDGMFVTINQRPLNLYLNIMNHSPTGFAWGYQGSGPAQLALAIMVSEYGQDLHDHPVHYQEFKREVVAELPDTFTLSSLDVCNWVVKHMKSGT